jgi:hypothetical protein
MIAPSFYCRFPSVFRFPALITALAWMISICFPSIVHADNLISNPGFESDKSGWVPFVPGESKDKMCSFLISGSLAHSGSACAEISSEDFARFGIAYKDTISVRPGERYRVGAWVKATPGSQVKKRTPGFIIRFTLQQGRQAAFGNPMIFIGLNGKVAVAPDGDLTELATALPTEWTKMEAVVELPAEGVDNIGMGVFGCYTKGSIFIDDISVEKVSGTTALSPLTSKYYVGEISGTTPLSPLTSKLDDKCGAKVLSALDLTQPELAPVAAAVQKNDQAAALKAFASYLRNRKTVHWMENPDGSGQVPLHFRKEIANAAANGRVQGGMVDLVHSFPNGEIDWHYNATAHTQFSAHNVEWQWQLNRMSFWDDLAGAYTATGDEKYAQAFVRQMRSWVFQCPVPNHADNVAGSAWRTIDAGIRMGGSWPDAYFAFVRSSSMSDDDLIAMAASFLDHGRYLRACHTRFNWFTFEMSGLYAVGSVFPEFKEATDWRVYAAKGLADENQRQFLPDGAQVEISPGYLNAALDNVLHVPQIALWNNRQGELPPGFVETLEKAYAWQLGFLTPNRSTPKFNDSWECRGMFKKAVKYFPKRDDFQWVATDGTAGTAPNYTSIFMNRSGFAAMRSSWEKDANYLIFRVGPAGAGHQHQDSLDVLIWPYGRELLFNNGGGSYEQSKWREWAVSTFSHNCVIVDGLAQSVNLVSNDPLHDPALVSQGPIDAHWKSTPVFDYATGVYNQVYGPQHLRPAIQRRDVLFLKPDLFIVADRFIPADKTTFHTYQARWQLLTTQTRIDSATDSLVTGDSGLPNLSIVPLLHDRLVVTAASAKEVPEILGWDVRKDKNPECIPATTLLHTLSGSGPQTMLTLFVPLKPGQPNPVSKVEAENNGKSVAVVFTDKRRFSISCSGEQGIDVKEILPDGTPGRAASVSAR